MCRRRPVKLAVRVLLPILAVALACGDGPSGPAQPGPPAAVTLSAKTVQLTAIGAGRTLTATVADANGIVLSGVAVDWSSADEDVATVDGSGQVEAVGVGETEVTAAAGQAGDTAVVTVTQTATSISVDPTASELDALGDSVRYAATVRDANGVAIEDAAVEWTSTDEDVATVNVDGWVIAEGNGTATIRAAVGELSDAATVIVEQVAASVDVTPAVDTLRQGETTTLAAEVSDANGHAVPETTVVWITSEPTAAPVDQGGNVTAVGWFTEATITASAGDASGTAAVHVLDQLAFMRRVSTSNYEIYVMNADGSGQSRLTNDVALDESPAWSPDGSQIAFNSTRDGDIEVYIMNADGSGQTNLTNDPAVDGLAAWSPDGSRIAFMSNRDGNGEIYLMNADGTDPVRLTDDPSFDDSPAWSPDGSRIAFRSTRDGNAEIYTMNADGSDPVRLTDDPSLDSGPAWSPDGSRIAFSSNRDGPNPDIYVMNADGSDPVRITNDPAIDVQPAWSPDGSRIAFNSSRNGNSEIYVVNADGSDPVRLTNDPAFNNDSPAWRPRP